MKAKRHYIRSLLLAAVTAFAGAMPGKGGAGVETRITRIPADAFLCEGRAFVVAGAVGIGMTSLDGVTWVPKAVTVTTNWRSHCRGNGVFVGIDHGGSLQKSSDGTEWTARDARVAFALHRVAYGSGRFVAVGNEGALVTSDDGITWTAQDSGTDERLRGVAYGNATFVVVGYAGTVLVSYEGTHWKRRPAPTDVRLLDVAFGNGMFVAVGWHGWIMTSPDGLRWRRIRSGTMSHLWRAAFGWDTVLEGGAPVGSVKSSCTHGIVALPPDALIKHYSSKHDEFGEADGTTKLPMSNEINIGPPGLNSRKIHT